MAMATSVIRCHRCNWLLAVQQQSGCVETKYGAMRVAIVQAQKTVYTCPRCGWRQEG